MTNGIRKTVLAIDDDPVVLEAINATLGKEYNILLCRDGHEGFEMANNHDVHLILLDIMMPGFDGFSTLLLLKDTEKTKGIPVVMLTSVGKREKVVEAFRDGAAEYILKPFRPEVLKRKIENLINREPPAG